MKPYVFTLIVVCFCLSAKAQEVDDSENVPTMQVSTEAIQKLKSKIGKKYWASNTSVDICDTLTKDPSGCKSPAGKPTDEYGPFLIKKGIVMDPGGLQVSFLVETPDHQLKFLRTYFQDRFVSDEERKRQIKIHAQAKADCNRRGGVSIGMSEQEVLASCWGKPRERNVTNTEICEPQRR